MIPLARAMALAVVPAVAAVAVTVGVPVVLAVTPAVAGVPQALIASPRLVARPDVVESTKKLAVVLVAHEVELPLVPAVTTLPLAHVKVVSAPPTVKVLEVPSSVSMTVSVLPPPLAVTPVAAEEQALIAAARFVARVEVLKAVIYLPVALPVHEVEPLVTAAPTLSVTEPHEKLPATGRPTARNVPGFVWTTFTVAEFALAVTPKAAGHALIASAMLEATLLLIVATVLVAKCPVKVAPTLLHVFVPSSPPLWVQVPKTPVSLVERLLIVFAPSFDEVIVTVLPLPPGVPMPRAVAHVPVSAVRTFEARPAVVDAAAKLATMLAPEPVHVAFEPLAPALVLVQEKPLRVRLSERKAPGFESVTVKVLALLFALGVLRPSCEAQTPMALAEPSPRFKAKPPVVLLMAKLAVRFGATPPHETEVAPSVPPERGLVGLKLLKLLVSVMLFPDVPGFKAVMFTTPEPGAAELTPTNEPQPAVLMTVLRRVASVLAVVLRVKLAFFGLVASPHPVVLPPEATAVTMREFDPLVIVNV